MSDHPITQQPESTNSIFTLMPNEHIRFEYNYKPDCCCFSSKRTLITNMRLITSVTKSPAIFSSTTASGAEKTSMIFLTNINNIKQIQSRIPSSKNKWWMQCMELCLCTYPDQQIDWLESCRGADNLAMDLTESTGNTNNIPERVLIEKF